ncbi:MAG: hypothetical protein M0Q38_01040 [Bacteroidales bacterium]|jgi:hypothetical protein|nr:hypothetical protein [Bacteroidales bacterium]
MRLQIIREACKNFIAVGFIFKVILFFASILMVSAQEKTVTFYVDPAAVPPDLPITFKHLSTHVSFKPEQNQVIRIAAFTVIPNHSNIDSIVFYTLDFQISNHVS